MQNDAQFGIINRYRPFLGVSENAEIVSLNEGNTPLIKLHSLSSETRGIDVFAKCE